jgi:hypothetical protein
VVLAWRKFSLKLNPGTQQATALHFLIQYNKIYAMLRVGVENDL